MDATTRIISRHKCAIGAKGNVQLHNHRTRPNSTWMVEAILPYHQGRCCCSVRALPMPLILSQDFHHHDMQRKDHRPVEQSSGARCWQCHSSHKAYSKIANRDFTAAIMPLLLHYVKASMVETRRQQKGCSFHKACLPRLSLSSPIPPGHLGVDMSALITHGSRIVFSSAFLPTVSTNITHIRFSPWKHRPWTPAPWTSHRKKAL